jgi:outer membrane protein
VTARSFTASGALALCLLLFPEAPALAASPSSTLTLGAALRRAVEANRTAGRVRAEAAIADEQSRFLYAHLFPQVSVSGHYTRNADEAYFELEGMRINILPLDDWSYRLSVQQPIFAGGREIRAYRQSRLMFQNAQQEVRSAEDGALLRTASSFLTAIQGQQLVEVERRNIALSERRRAQANDFYEAGEVTRVDILRAESAVKAAQRRLAGAIQMRDSALSALRLELALDGDVAIDDKSIDLPPLPSPDDLIASAEAQRPEIRQAENLVHAANLQVRNERAAYLPIVTADASYVEQKSNFPTDVFTAVTLNFSVPVWDNGKIRSRIATARQQEHQAALILAEARQGVREQVRLALLDLETSDTTLALTREQLEATEAEYQQIFDLYTAQEATSLDVDAAESALAEARRAVVAGTLDRQLAELRVWYAAGALKNAVLEDRQ